MNKLKHTPGPWSYSRCGKHWNNPELVRIEINYGDDGECIADTVYQEDDARLIAAAPEMLQAIIKIRSELYPHVGSPTQDKINLVGILVNLCDRKIENATGQKIEELI